MQYILSLQTKKHSYVGSSYYNFFIIECLHNSSFGMSINTDTGQFGMSINTDTGQVGMSINTDTGQYDDGDCLYILYDHLLHCGKFWGSSTNKHYIIHHESTRLLILYFTSLEQNIAGSLKWFVFAFLINLYIVDVPLKQCHTK